MYLQTENYTMRKVFLGGTCNGSLWRDELIKDLKIDYFQPVGDHWTPDMMEEEKKQREICDYCLYVLTPKMTGYYSVAELIEDSIKQPGKTIFCYLPVDEEKSFSPVQIRSMEQVAEMVKRNGALYFNSLNEVAEFLNNH